MKELSIENLSKEFGKITIFKNLNLCLSSGKAYFLTDENGSGKTTFFKCLLNELSYSGKINDMGYLYAFMPEKPIFPETYKMIDFLKLFYLYDHDETNIKELYELINDFNIEQYQNNRLYTLSKGTRQKVALIKTILMEADIYLFDEPLSGLDANSRNIFAGMLNRLIIQDKIIIIATHYYDDYVLLNKEKITLK